MGAAASIRLAGPSHLADPALVAARDTIRRMERLFSLYDPVSALSRLNRDGQLDMPPEFQRLMAEVDRMHRVTEGLFDPTVQPLWAALAEGRSVDGIADRVGWGKVRIDGAVLRFERKGMALTLNGIAQGFATDQVHRVLRAHGFKDLVVNVGEYVVGEKSRTLGISGPDGQLLETISVRNHAVATTSPLALTLADGRGHIVDPSRRRAQSIWHTVSVVAKSATVADATSTALALANNRTLADRLTKTKVIQSARMF